MRGPFLALVIGIGASALGARVESATPPPAQTVQLGDAHVQSHLPVALVIEAEARSRIATALTALVSGTSVPPEETTTRMVLEVVWNQGAPDQRVLPLDADAVLLPVAPHQCKTYAYFVRVRDVGGRFEARFPASPGMFRVDAAAADGPTVVDGTGDGEAAQGELIPIHVRLAQPSRVGEVMLFHRSSAASPWTSAAMEVSERTDSDAVWAASVQRPLERAAQLEYYVRARDVNGRMTEYGAPGRPHCLKLSAPVVAGEGDP